MSNGQRPAARLAQMDGKTVAGAIVSATNSCMTRRTSSTRSATASLWCRRSMWVWTVCGEMPRSAAMVKSVWSSQTPRTICSSRDDNVSERAISAHACSLNEQMAGEACYLRRSFRRIRQRPMMPPIHTSTIVLGSGTEWMFPASAPSP